MKDCEILDIEFDENFIKSTSKLKFKKIVQEKVQRAALKQLNSLKSGHSKVRIIRYSKLASQGYINSELFTNEEIDTLFALRSKMIRVKNNFYNGNSNTL